MMSFLSLLLFDYEFNFFHLISLKKNNEKEKNELKLKLEFAQKENEQLKLIYENSASKKLVLMDVETLTSTATAQNKSKLEAIESKKASKMEQSDIIVTKTIKKKRSNSIKTFEDLNSNTKIDDVEKEMSRSMPVKPESLSLLTADPIENKGDTSSIKKQLQKHDTAAPCSKIVSIGLSKTVTQGLGSSESSLMESSPISFERELTDNDYGEDDEDIYVILDEK